MECLSGTPFQDDLTQAFAKLDGVLGSRLRAFLDRLPEAIQAKPGPTPRRVEAQQRKTVGRLLDAILQQQRLSMRYHSMSSRKEKSYRIDPYRLVYAQGSLYLFAYVPAYEQVRTFAVDRIRRLSPIEETFEVIEHIGDTVFAHSLGMHAGSPERGRGHVHPRRGAVCRRARVAPVTDGRDVGRRLDPHPVRCLHGCRARELDSGFRRGRSRAGADPSGSLDCDRAQASPSTILVE